MLHILGMCSNSHPKEAEEERELKVKKATSFIVSHGDDEKQK